MKETASEFAVLDALFLRNVRHVLDPDGQAAKAYGVNVTLSTGLPVSVLVARDGTVSSYEPFPLTRDYLDPALQKILS